jgi:SOS-response transcriptional repressor LexA
VQAGMMTEVVDPFALGEGLELITTDLDLTGRAFGLIIEGNSMAPEFNEGDKIIIDPSLAPRPGDYVVAKNGHEEATFKKYRPRGTDDSGNLVFELVPLNDDYPTLNSQRDHMQVIGVMVEHRKYRRR